MTPTGDARLEWGHALLTPEGDEIRLPKFAFPRLRRLGLLERNRELGLYQLSPMVYELLDSSYEGLMGGLRRVLGMDLDGPKWLECRCLECREKRRNLVRNDGRDWKEIQSARKPGFKEF